MNQNKKTFSSSVLFYAILFIFSFSLLLAPQTVYGQEAHDWNSWEIIPSECLAKDGDCNLNSFVKLFVNLSYIMLKIIPYLAMLMMIVGGFALIAAGGKQERVQTGKRVITSVVLGVVIVTGLAWALSFFIVSALTGDTDQESGTIFKGYKGIWEKEWWGGGESMVYPINSGCCIINEHGCKETTEEDCQNRGELFGVDAQYMGNNQFCSQYVNPCDNYKVGCCVPNATGDDQCFVPNENGCLDWSHTTHQTSNCINIATCDKNKISGAVPEGGDQGCCVSTHNCTATSYSNCSDLFYSNTDCSSLNECTTGCCVGLTWCKSGKINCDGSWNSTACDIGPTNPTDCERGCCETTNNCAQSTRGKCIGNFTINTDCGDIVLMPDCYGGCCVTNCTDNKIDGNCPDSSYVTDACGFGLASDCQQGCCRYNGATNCSENIYLKNCQSGGDTWFGAVPCPTGAGQACETGCCELGPSNCIEDTANSWCTGTFHAGTSCGAVSGC